MPRATSKQLYTQQVLAFLSQSSHEHISVEDVATATNLGAVVYPVLSKLHEQGMVEPHWLQKVAGPQLNYQITLKGLESLRRAPMIEKPVRSAIKAEPALSQLKTKLETDSSSSK